MIDRRALVSRHDVRRTTADPVEPLSVGNGEFAFTTDVTGLQSLPQFHDAGMPLGTQSQWGWHTAPNPENFSLDEAWEPHKAADGRLVDYVTTGADYSDPGPPSRARRAREWLRENPHRTELGTIGFVRSDGEMLDVSDITDIEQHLDLWRGLLISQFTVDGLAVRVTTVCHPTLDALAVRVETSADLRISIRFAYAVGGWSQSRDWNADDKHSTEVVVSGQRCDIRRVIDADKYHVAIEHTGVVSQPSSHEIQIVGAGEFTVAFSPDDALPAALPSVDSVVATAEAHWSEFWSTGAALDLSGSTDPRASELERRVVLSQYLTAIHCAGSTPPQETGLVTNSWRGKFHLEMHWWHAAHFVLWGRAPLLERSLEWYLDIMPVARKYAERQGYSGVRWPKQIGPEGRESPSDVGTALIWQQPHPIHFVELLWQQNEDPEILQRYADLVFATAEFMADYPVWNEQRGAFCLGPPLASAQEKAFRERHESLNPTFELAYWAWGLRTAQAWRERLGLTPVPLWDHVADNLAPLPVRDGVYVELEHPVTRPEGHPTMVGALGLVPDLGLVDENTMRATLNHVLADWELDDTWGWDYPLLAMTACRLDEPELAIDALMVDTTKNTYLGNGHNFQKLPQLPLYLPGNGGLLFAVAMMAGGWGGAADRSAPGFPSEGWQVRAEGFRPAL